jgi:hypothetical protein
MVCEAGSVPGFLSSYGYLKAADQYSDTAMDDGGRVPVERAIRRRDS